MSEHTHHASSTGHPEAAAHHVNYWLIFGALCILTLVSAAADWLGGDSAASHAGGSHAAAPSGKIGGAKLAVILVVMAVAIAKATFVLMYFMHVKFEGRWIYAMLLPTTVLALAIPAALLPDIGLHYYNVETPQQEEYLRSQAAGEVSHPEPKAHP